MKVVDTRYLDKHSSDI